MYNKDMFNTTKELIKAKTIYYFLTYQISKVLNMIILHIGKGMGKTGTLTHNTRIF